MAHSILILLLLDIMLYTIFGRTSSVYASIQGMGGVGLGNKSVHNSFPTCVVSKLSSRTFITVISPLKPLSHIFSCNCTSLKKIFLHLCLNFILTGRKSKRQRLFYLALQQDVT